MPADQVLHQFFRTRRELGPLDRAFAAEVMYAVLRRWRSLNARASVSGPSAAAALPPIDASTFAAADAGAATTDAAPAPATAAVDARAPTPRRLVLVALTSVFGLSARALEPAIGRNDREWLAATHALDLSTLPPAVALDIPDWLYQRLCARFDARETATLVGALNQPAPLDLRVNLLKSDRAAVMAALTEAGIEAELMDGSATAIRVSGKPAIERLAAFTQGWFEVQDAGSQRLVEFAAPRRGQTVVDFCAGAGGKTLAMAAAMRSSGQIYACDVSATRLQRLRPRLLRSGASNVQPFGLDSDNDPKLRRLAGRADLVLVDAPCSGTGTLRRNPELKWRLAPESIDELSRLQMAILESAARLVKPAGSLVYATCSLLRPENEAIVEAFCAAHPEFAEPTTMELRPDESGSDGFFAARWVRRPL
jgi:16S rRNA (cytosine967-C5)-methyltransferase